MNNRLREPRRFIRQEASVALVALLGPTLSPDGRYLFFTRHTRMASGEQEDIYWVENPLSRPALREASAPK
jgi:hypothetical protein